MNQKDKIDIVSICLDKKTKRKIDEYAKVRHITRSAMIRLLLNEIFFSKEKEGEVMR
jgi:predicted transcriptional regulator